MPGCEWMVEGWRQWAVCLLWLLAVQGFQVLPGAVRKEGGRA